MKKKLLKKTLMLGASFILTSSILAQNHPTNGLVEYFGFGNTLTGSEGSILEAETPNFTTGYLENGAYHVNAASNELKSDTIVENFPAFNSDLTVCFWLKLNTNTTASLFNYVSFDGDILNENIHATGLAYDNNKLIISKAEFNTWTELNVNYSYNSEWHHVALVHIASGSSNFIYIDGVFQGSVTMHFTTPLFDNSKLQIGQSPGGAQFGDFEIDEFLIYDRTLSSDELLDMASQMANINETSSLKLEAYPNPTTSLLNIELNTPTSVSILNLLGKQLANFDGTTGVNTVDVSDLPAGVYFVQSANSSVKFVKN